MLTTTSRKKEKKTEVSKGLLICYVDRRKAFDSVWRKGCAMEGSTTEYQEKIVRLTEQLQRGP